MNHRVDLVFVTIHSTYTTVSIGLFGSTRCGGTRCDGTRCGGARCIEAISIDHKQACTQLLTSIDTLLKRHQHALTDLAFIAVNQGPGPYTTLRITLVTADGLSFATGSFATGIPLVGVDGFAAFVDEINNKSYDMITILLNAFCREVFYAIYDNSDGTMTTGYLPINELTEKLEALGKKKILVAGNGVTLFADELSRVKAPTLVHISPFQETASLEAIAANAYKKWLSGTGISRHLLPLYLKRPAYRMIAPDPSQP